MNKTELLKRTGMISQYAGITPFTYTDGKADGVSAYRVKTGSGLEFTVLKDRALDIFEATYKGTNLSFVTRNGLVSSKYFYPNPLGFDTLMAGGLFFTAGIRNTGNPGEIDGVWYPQHGRLHCIPATAGYTKSDWVSDDQLKFEIGGDMHDSMIETSLIMHRKIETQMDSSEIVITDTIENPECFAQDFAILYHINMGFPFVDEKAHIIIDKPYGISPFFEFDKQTVDSHKEFCPPEAVPERNYILDVEADDDGFATVRVESPNRGFGVYIKARKDTLPYFNEWKCVQPGVYTLAVEPSNNTLCGIVKEKEKGTMRSIAPYESIEHKVIFGVYDI